MQPQEEPKESVKLTIAVGHSRFSTHWKNEEMTWGEFKKRLSETTKTRETLTEFLNMSKAKQDAIKDVGGFVGGTLKEGRRKAENVAWRCVGTLDMDYAPSNFKEYVTACLQGKCYAAYGTHKDGPRQRRVRIVIPFSRPVTPDEYQAVMRRVAADIGIDYFDDTTYQPHRLMYWPSTPADIDYYFESHNGVWLDVDGVLGTYENWQDQSQWPASSREYKVIKRRAEKQEDPYNKKGLIGAFCRTYSIEDAMEAFIPGVYVKCDGKDDRYTYAAGSTSGGAIIYEGKFLYSHHSTDPISEQLVNAFDLVRIHKFRDLDDDAKDGTPATRMPSYLRMLDLAREDEKVKLELVQETLRESREDFTDLGDIEESDQKWMTKMRVSQRGGYEKCPWNIKLIISNDPRLKGCVHFDLFSHRAYLQKNLPWRTVSASPYWTNDDDSCLRNFVSDVYKIDGKGVVDDAFHEYLVRHSYHAVRQYLAGLPKWDGNPRVDTLLIDYLGADDTEFTRTATRKTLTAAVKRVMEPGCKFDYVLTLIGRQGLGKSFIWKRLAGKWCSDSMSTVTGKEAMEQLSGGWIIEMAELAALKRAELENVKQFISKQDDSYRPAYGRVVEHYDRQCIFVATTNNSDFIRDSTGGRRWWPVNVGARPRKKSPFDDLDDDEVAQIWAEALTCYELDEPLYLDEKMEEEARRLQGEHTEESPWAGVIRQYLEMLLPENWKDRDIEERRAFVKNSKSDFDQPDGTAERKQVCAAEVWCEMMGGDMKNMSRMQAIEINNVLKNIDGWEPARIRFPIYGMQRGFKRID